MVIAIIAILAALLLPALREAKESAIRIQCMNNHKQLSLGISNYAIDYDNFLPPQAGFTFQFHNDNDLSPRGLGYLFTSGELENRAVRLIACPGYGNNVNNFTAGNDASFNVFNRDSNSGQGYSQVALGYRYASVNYSYMDYNSIPSSWVPSTGTWASAEPDGITHTIKIDSKMAQVVQIRTACIWNPNGGVGALPTGSSWINPYTHRVRGANVSLYDGSASWLNGKAIYPTQTGTVYHWRQRFWDTCKDILNRN